MADLETGTVVKVIEDAVEDAEEVVAAAVVAIPILIGKIGESMVETVNHAEGAMMMIMAVEVEVAEVVVTMNDMIIEGSTVVVVVGALEGTTMVLPHHPLPHLP